MYRMPAEWEEHEGTWIAWPHNKKHWPGNFDPIPRVYAKMVRALAESEKVFICVNDEKMEEEAKKLIEKLDNVFFFQIPTNSTWTRDYGAIFVRDEENKLVITNWIFNAWGEKYPPWDKDDIVPQKVGEIIGKKVIEPGIVLEGGSIDVNGQGTLLTTEQCITKRNPTLSKEAIEEYFKKYLGAKKTLWLKEGIVGDETDGHIDAIARFVNPDTVVCVVEKNPEDQNYATLKKNFEDLQNVTDQDGKALKIIPLPTPEPVIYEDQQLPANYANFYIGNKIILLPTFNCPQDEEATRILSELFPTRKVVGIDCRELIWGYGAFHCSTQQQPRD